MLILGVAYKKDIDDLRESPSLTIIELLQKEGAEVSYNDPFFEYVGRGRKYNLEMKNTPLENLAGIRLRSDCDRPFFVRLRSDCGEQSNLVIDTRNATKGIESPKIVRC